MILAVGITGGCKPERGGRGEGVGRPGAHAAPSQDPVVEREAPRAAVVAVRDVPIAAAVTQGIFKPVVRPAVEASRTGSWCDAFTLTGALFETNSTVLTSDAHAVLDLVAPVLREHVGEIVVHGHADERPTDYPGGNDALSAARAWAVAVGLVDRQVDPEAITDVEGFGATRPVDPAHTSHAYRLNRRVEIGLVCAESTPVISGTS